MITLGVVSSGISLVIKVETMRSDSGVANADKVEISILGGTFELRGGDIEHYSSETLFTSRNCCSREGMKAKSFEEGLAEVTETLKRLQFTLLFHQSKLEESIRQARQEFSLARQDFTLASEKFHRLIKATI
ncbi:hypothetical protein Tco_1413128 [Tanacetum coccineum]